MAETKGDSLDTGVQGREGGRYSVNTNNYHSLIISKHRAIKSTNKN